MFPIFAFSFFIILYLIELVLTLLVITIPVAEILSFITDFLLILWLISRGGFKKIKNIKTMRRFATQAIANKVPFLNVFPWTPFYIYQEYKAEQKEKEEEKVKEEEGVAGSVDKEDREDQMGEEIQDKESESDGAIINNGPSRLEQIEEERNMRNAKGKNPWIQNRGNTISQNEDDAAGGRSDPARGDIKSGADMSGRRDVLRGVREKELKDTPAELRLGEQLSDPDALNKNYKGEDMLAANDPLFFKRETERKEIEKKNKTEEQKKMQGLNKKKNLAEELAAATRILAAAREKYGRDGGKNNLINNLEKKVEKLNSK